MVSSIYIDTSIGPASVMVGNLVQGNRLAVATGRELNLCEDNERRVSSIIYTLLVLDVSCIFI